MKNLELANAVKRLKDLFGRSNCVFLCNSDNLTENDHNTISLLFNWELREEFLKSYKTETSTIGCLVFLFKSDSGSTHRQIRLDYLDFVIAKFEKDE